MALPMMPKATAVWLVENTALTFQQIAAFCGLHELEVKAIADGEIVAGMVGLDPIASGQLTKEELERCGADPKSRLELAKSDLPVPKAKPKGARYTPVSKRQDKPDAISWLLRTYPEMSDAAIGRLLGTTKQTINAVRDRTHWNSANIRPRDPVELGLCSVVELSNALKKFRSRRAVPEEAPAEGEAPAPAPETTQAGGDDPAPAESEPSPTAEALFPSPPPEPESAPEPEAAPEPQPDDAPAKEDVFPSER